MLADVGNTVARGAGAAEARRRSHVCLATGCVSTEAACASRRAADISAYSLRIAGVSAMRLVLHVEPEFVRRWGLWSSFAMVDTYTRFDYGPGAVLAQLWGWASSQQWRGTEVLAQGAAASGATAALLRLA